MCCALQAALQPNSTPASPFMLFVIYLLNLAVAIQTTQLIGICLSVLTYNYKTHPTTHNTTQHNTNTKSTSNWSSLSLLGEDWAGDVLGGRGQKQSC